MEPLLPPLLDNGWLYIFGLSYIERPILGDHLKAHKFGFCGLHEKREKRCGFREKCAVFVKSTAVFVKSAAFRKTTCKEL